MIRQASTWDVVRALLAHPRMALARPSVNRFLCQYLRKFRVQDVGGNLILHSHLPPLNSAAYARFVSEHLLSRSIGPSHAQIGLTNACPQNCEYCYNKGRAGERMDTETIVRTIQELKQLGLIWLGLTGGEPLLNKDIVKIVASAGEDVSVKLFTTGCTLTRKRALELHRAGLFSVSISLDHWDEREHDRVRRYEGAFRTALQAIETFRSIDGMHVGVSAVLSKPMLRADSVEEFLTFLRGLEVHEAWISEAKPSVAAYQRSDLVITDEERAVLIDLQDRHNRKGGMTVNYLGHFEDARHFGCAAGHKMLSIDAFGDVSPCVFIPMSFGNVLTRSIKEIFGGMLKRFPSEDTCFINRHFERLQREAAGTIPIRETDSERIVDSLRFGPLARYFRLQYR